MLGVVPVRLDQQYRMHSALTAFPYSAFYDDKFQNAELAEKQKLVGMMAFPWPNPTDPLFFWNTHGQEELTSSGASYFNTLEVANVEKLVYRLVRAGVKPQQIGIIMSYEEQKQHLIHHLRQMEIYTVSEITF